MLIIDPGSCHNGKLKLAKELVKIGLDSGADMVKFQLLTEDQIKIDELTGKSTGNIPFPWVWMQEFLDQPVFASVFNEAGKQYLATLGIKTIKFAYSMQHMNPFIKAVNEERREYWDNPFKTVYRSCGVMDELKDWAKNLWCIPKYPVLYHPNFEYIFPVFQGFSSHCMGVEQEKRAIKYMKHEKIEPLLEIHMKGTWESDCPDYRFAKSPKEVEKICKAISRKTV